MTSNVKNKIPYCCSLCGKWNHSTNTYGSGLVCLECVGKKGKSEVCGVNTVPHVDIYELDMLEYEVHTEPLVQVTIAFNKLEQDLSIRPKNLLDVKARVDEGRDQVLNLLVDTGVACNLISKSLWKK